MFMDFLSVVLVVAFLYAVISLPVGLFNLKVFRALTCAKCSGLNFLVAFLPLYNITFARKMAYGRSPVVSILLAFCALLMLFRVAALVLVAAFPILVVFSSMTTLLCIALYLALYIINCVDFCRMFNCGVITILCGILAPPIGYYLLSTQVLGYFRSVEDTVSGRFGD